MAQSAQRSNILLLVVELCSLTFRKQDRPKSKIVATALFGDGAFAAVITSRPRVRRKRLADPVCVKIPRHEVFPRSENPSTPRRSFRSK